MEFIRKATDRYLYKTLSVYEYTTSSILALSSQL